METPEFKPVWKEEFEVRSFDIGLNSRMRLNTVCSYFQEIAGRHATHLGAGYRFMQETGRVWVLSRLYMKIEQLPGWNQKFIAETWPLGLERIFFRREYRIVQDQNTLISASSYWLLLDIQSRRPVTFNLDPEVLAANKGKLALEIADNGFSPVTGDVSKIHSVVYSDLDQNRHVNNARYVAWIMDCFDAGFHETHSPSYFSIEYKHEVKAGADVEIRLTPQTTESNCYNIEGKIAATGQVCMRSKIFFSEISI